MTADTLTFCDVQQCWQQAEYIVRTPSGTTHTLCKEHMEATCRLIRNCDVQPLKTQKAGKG